MYGLALSRTLGDRFLKQETESAIIAEPHVSAPHRAPAGSILVVGSDGLWDVTTPQKAVEIAAAAREEWGMRKECAEALLRHARNHRSRDDCSVVVVDLDAHALGLHVHSGVPTLKTGVGGAEDGGRLSVGGLGSPLPSGTTPTAAAGLAAWDAAGQQQPGGGRSGGLIGGAEPTTPPQEVAPTGAGAGAPRPS